MPSTTNRTVSTHDKVLIQVRLPRDLVRQVDHYAIDHDLTRAQAVEELLTAGLEDGSF